MGNVVDFWEDVDKEKSEQEECFDSFEDEMKEDGVENESEEQEEEEKPIRKLDLNNLCTKFLAFKDPSEYAENSGKIQTNMYQYMIDNYEKVMYWITSLAKTPTCRKKFEILAENTHVDAEDLVQETYMRILKTFKDNEDRLKVCQACKHQCKEFINKTKRTNTEKYTRGYDCRPYMYYNYSENQFHNYINRSVKQNIDIKLKRITNANGERICAKMEEPVGAGEDACELGTLLSDTLGVNSEATKELIENLLSKKIVFVNKLASMSMEPDIFDRKEEIIEIPNDKYNEEHEKQKAEKREVYERYNLSIPESLRPIPKMLKCNLGLPISDMMEEFNSKFDMIPSRWPVSRVDKLIKQLYERAENEDYIKIGSPLTKELKMDLLKHYHIRLKAPELEDVLPDEFIKKVQIAQGEDPELVEEAAMQAALDMMECLPSKEDLNSYLENGEYENYLNYLEYLKNWNSEEDIQMAYNEKTTEIKIVDKDCKIIPLPLYTYAEITIRDFLDLCYDIKQGSEFFNHVFSNSDQVISFKEFWVDFENRSYSIAESFEYTLSKSKRKEIYRLEKLARRMRGKNLDPVYKEAQEIFVKSAKSIVDQFSKELIAKVCKLIKQEAINTGYGKYVLEKKILFPIRRKRKLTLEERKARAQEEFNKIMALRQSIYDNETHNINAAMEDTQIPNLNHQELFSSILEKIPVQEFHYVLEEVKVLCTSQSDNLKNVLSV